MSPSRNDPCPCGSGRKYKACHLRADEEAARMGKVLGPEAAAALEARVEEAARQAPYWEVDVVPLSGRFHESGEPGALATVVAGGLVLCGEVLVRRPVGLRARARAVLDAVTVGARKTGLLPERLHVRDDDLAHALGPELESRGMSATAAPLPELDELLESALPHLAGDAMGAAVSMLWRWEETEASAAELAELHAATAAFHRAAPWRELDDDDPLLLSFPDDPAPWMACVMGGAGVHYGLALYSDPRDVELLLQTGETNSETFFAAGHGLTLSLGFNAAHELPKPLRREVASAGWDVAEADAFPSLTGVHVPGRRITAELVRRMSLACRAVVAFLGVGEGAPLPWTHPGTGVVVDLADDEDDPLALPWPPLLECHPIGPAGRNADPQAAVRADRETVMTREEARLERFERWVERRAGSRASRDRVGRTALQWARSLVFYQVPAEAVTEFDLRRFLYEYLARLDPPTKVVARHLTRSLREIYLHLQEKEKIEYPWAGPVLDWLDEVTAGEDDVREVLEVLGRTYVADMMARVQRPQSEVGGVPGAWGLIVGEEMEELRNDLHRSWLIWHDEVLAGGITRPDEVREVLIGRQRQWENTPHDHLGGRTPKVALMEALKAEGRLA